METNTNFDVTKLINEREKVHGNFESFASTYKQVTNAIQHHPGYSNLDPTQAVAIDMVVNKICRILNGDPSFLDHWQDIIGYTTLGGRL